MCMSLVFCFCFTQLTQQICDAIRDKKGYDLLVDPCRERMRSYVSLDIADCRKTKERPLIVH